MSEYATAARWVYKTLRAEPLLDGVQIFEGVADDNLTNNGAVPHIVITSYGDGIDTNYMNGRFCTSLDITVRVWFAYPVGEGFEQFENASTVVDVVDRTIMGHRPGIVDADDRQVLSCTRTKSTEGQDLNEGTVWRYLGGIYHVVVTPLNK